MPDQAHLPPAPDEAAPGAPTGAEEDRQFCLRLARELAELSMDLARTAQAEAKRNPAPAALGAFERVARGARRTLLLIAKLNEPPRRPPGPDPRREVARRVGERIAAHCRRDQPRAEDLRAELAERLDRLDSDGDLRRRPAPDIAAQICADLGLDTPGPADLARLFDAELLRIAHPAGGVWPPEEDRPGPAHTDWPEPPQPAPFHPKRE